MSKSPQQPRQAAASRVRQSVVIPLILAVLLLLGAVYGWDLYFLRHEEQFGNSRYLLRPFDRWILDNFHVHGRKTPARDDILVIGIDSQSLQLDTLFEDEIDKSPALKAMKVRYPWPRRVWAAAIDKLADAGAKAIFLDLVFKSPSEDPEDDRLLLEAVKRHRDKVVLGAQFFEFLNANGDTGATLLYPSMLDPANPECPVGHLNFWPESRDGVIREIHYQILPSQAEIQNIKASDEGRYDLHEGHVVPDASEKPFPSVAVALVHILNPRFHIPNPAKRRLRFCDPGAFEPNSFYGIFVPDLWKATYHNGELLKDKIVMIGATASELHDLQPIPVAGAPIDGVKVHAHALSALAAVSYIDEVDPTLWYIGTLLLGGVLAWLFVTFIGHPVVALTGMWVFTAGIVDGCFWAFNHWSVELAPLPCSLALNLCGSIGLMGNFFVQQVEKRKLHRYLGRYTSPQVANEMVQDRVGLFTTLSGAERMVTIFFSDVRDFTSMAEKMDSKALVTKLNEYLSRMVECVFSHRGTVDKFIGDAVMALWGSTRFYPTEETQREDARNALQGALAMRAALAKLNEEWARRGMDPYRFGMGIHQGIVTVGNIGSIAPFEKMDFTVIGDNVNLASRLEGATKDYGVDLIISEEVWKYVHEEFQCRSADLVRVKGRHRPVKVYAVLGPRQKEEVPGLADYEDGVQLYRLGKFEEAIRAFESAAALGLDDTLTRGIYIKRCEALVAAPPQEWEGVFTRTTK